MTQPFYSTVEHLLHPWLAYLFASAYQYEN